jgi:hypothetical protein
MFVTGFPEKSVAKIKLLFEPVVASQPPASIYACISDLINKFWKFLPFSNLLQKAVPYHLISMKLELDLFHKISFSKSNLVYDKSQYLFFTGKFLLV